MTSSQTHTSAQQPSSKRTLDVIGQSSLNTICAAPGPFVTVFLPARHPGSMDLPRVQGLKAILRNAAQELERRRFQGPVDQLLKPLKALAEDAARVADGGDSVIFLSPGSFHHLGLSAPTAERLIVASHPHITPVLPHLVSRQEFYILAIAKKHLRLARWHNGQCSEVPLPGSIPDSFEEGLVFEQPDHDLQNRSVRGQAGQTRFGTGSERDLVHRRLSQYFQVVDRELTGILRGARLVLVGIAQELAAYRAASEFPHLLSAVPGSPEHLSWDELKERGQAAILEAHREEAERVLVELRETVRRDHVIKGLRHVLEAAREGRIHKLLVENHAESQGLLGPSFPVDSARLEGEQDLVNAAVVETIRGHGEVYILDEGELGDSSPLAAVLRYSE